MAAMRINVIGLGNILHSDEGFGVRAMEQLSGEWGNEGQVAFIDGGTQGVYLLDYLESCDGVIVLDAIIPEEYDRQVYVYEGVELPSFIHRKMSSHQMGFSELLGLARLHGRMPRHIALIGIPPRELHLSTELSDEVAALLPEAVAAAKHLLTTWLAGTVVPT